MPRQTPQQGTYVPAQGNQPTGPQPMPPQPRPLDQPQPGGGPAGGPGTQAGVPLVDIIDNPQAVVVLVDLPGFEKEEIEIEANGHAVRIFAVRDTDLAERERSIQRERAARIERIIELPASIDVEESGADYENGVLEITLPKAGDERRRTIGIH